MHRHLPTLTAAGALLAGAWAALGRAMHAAETRESERRG